MMKSWEQSGKMSRVDVAVLNSPNISSGGQLLPNLGHAKIENDGI